MSMRPISSSFFFSNCIKRENSPVLKKYREKGRKKQEIKTSKKK